MHMSLEMLYDMLTEKCEVRRYGLGIKAQALSLPMFYKRGAELHKEMLYLARTSDLPSLPSEECLFVCVGACPTNLWNWHGEVFYIADSEVDLLTAFNYVQEIYYKLINWDCNMLAVLKKNADVEEMLRISIPVFENRIAVIDYDLEMIAYCQVVESSGKREVQMSNAYSRVPNENSVLFEDVHKQYIKRRDPFVYNEHGIDQYCINLYVGDEYMGTCSLMAEYRPVRKSDYEMFQLFANHIRNAISMQSKEPSSRFVTLKTIFTQLLQSLPVSRSDTNRALDNFQKEKDLRSDPIEWTCIVIRSSNVKTLPEGYLCTTIENLLPNCIAAAYDGALVGFCMSARNRSELIDTRENLKHYLKDMDFLAGISMPFADIYKSRSYYLQAVCALDTGYSQDPSQKSYEFSDSVLTYMLLNCIGQFEPDMLMIKGLSKLYDCSKSGVDYWDTLKRYLDNESNASRTAQEMFLHRSTLLPRLEKIKTLVDMDTPDQRLYLRMCMRLYDILGLKGS